MEETLGAGGTLGRETKGEVVLFDAVRGGSVCERAMALELLEKRLQP